MHCDLKVGIGVTVLVMERQMVIGTEYPPRSFRKSDSRNTWCPVYTKKVMQQIVHACQTGRKVKLAFGQQVGNERVTCQIVV